MLDSLSVGTHRLSFECEGLLRSFLVFVPSLGRGSIPPVMLLHGAGGSAEWAAKETLFSQIAEAKNFCMIYPDGLSPNPDRAAKFLTNPQEWNDGSGRGRTDDVAFLLKLLDYLKIDRVCLTGFSNGAGMAFRFASEQSERVAALVAIAGHCYTSFKPQVPMPSWYITGDADPFIPLHGGLARTPWGNRTDRPPVLRTIRLWAELLGCSELPESATDWHNGLFEVTILKGQGHHWPGGEAGMGEKLGGPALETFNATQKITEFFQKVA